MSDSRKCEVKKRSTWDVCYPFITTYAPPPLFPYIYPFIRHPCIRLCPSDAASCLFHRRGWSMWTPPILPEWLNHCSCPLRCSYLKAWSPQSCCKGGGCLDSGTSQALPACPLELSCHINTSTLHWTAKHLAQTSRQAQALLSAMMPDSTAESERERERDAVLCIILPQIKPLCNYYKYPVDFLWVKPQATEKLHPQAFLNTGGTISVPYYCRVAPSELPSATCWYRWVLQHLNSSNKQWWCAAALAHEYLYAFYARSHPFCPGCSPS